MFSETSHTEKTIQMFMPEGKLDLGTPPRHCYPLVIFLIRDTPENSTLHPDETVSLHDMIYHFLILINIISQRFSKCGARPSRGAQKLYRRGGRKTILKINIALVEKI